MSNTKFCPNCQTECRNDQAECHECGFPLILNMTAVGNQRRIEAGELKRWNRIVALLRDSGIQIVQKPPKGPLSPDFWWSLPVIGVAVLLSVLLFGGSIADTIWPPTAIPPTQIVDLNQGSGQAGGAAEEDDVVAEDTSLLERALGVTDRQQELTDSLNFDPEDYVDQPTMSFDQIKTLAESALTPIQIKDRRKSGALLTGDGLLLTDISVLRGAFQTEVQTVQKDGRLVREPVYIVPRAQMSDGEHDTKLVEDAPLIGLALMQIPHSESLPYEVDYDNDLAPGQKLWTPQQISGRSLLTELRVSSIVQNLDGISVWTVEEQLTNQEIGSPVFNEYGRLTGVLLQTEGQTTVLSMLRLREKAPYIYRYLK